MRILRDPAPADGGGAPDEFDAKLAAALSKLGMAPGAKAAEEKPAPRPEDDGFIRVKREEYEGLTKIREQRESELKAERDRAEAERIKAGDFKKLWEELKGEVTRQQEKTAEEGRKYRKAFQGRELAAAVAGHDLLEGKAPILLKLIEDEFEIDDAGGAWAVVHKTTREPAAEAVKQLLATKYDNFVRSDKRGGAGATQAANRGAETLANQAQTPLTYEQAVIAEFKAARAQSQVAGGPVGLGRSMRRPS